MGNSCDHCCLILFQLSNRQLRLPWADWPITATIWPKPLSNPISSLSLSIRSPSKTVFYKKAASFVLRAVAKHSPDLARAVVDCGSLDALVICLEEFDPGVKEAAAWALGYI